MRGYWKEAEGIPEYINMLEDARKRSIRINKTNPITFASILEIATEAMLKSAPFPRANEEWESMPEIGKDWPAWKALYKRYQNQEHVKAQINGDNAFAAKEETVADATDQGKDPPAQFTLEDLEACFDNLACAAKADQDSIAELVKVNAALVKTNADLTAALAKLTAESKAQPSNNSRRRGGRNRGGGGGGSKDGEGEKCPICNHGVHAKEDCWELPQNASKRPAGWKSVL